MDFVRPRPNFPKRAVITSGMPYGNKLLHYGHLGMTVRADVFARFMRDRIGADNVIFVSGTDCYGSTAVESFRQLKESGNCPYKTIEEYVLDNHKKQKQIFSDFEIGFNLFGASAFGRTGEIHKQTSEYFIRTLFQNGMVKKRSSMQFFDETANRILNGRQVVGKCPIENCTSEHGYADECSLGHQYMPQDLIDPISTLTNKKPKLVKIENLYFNLENCIPLLKDWIALIEKDGDTPQFMTKEIKEFFKSPEIYIRREFEAKFNQIKASLPPFEDITKNEKAPSITIVFEKLTDRERACEVLSKNEIRYRTGKTLTPFRLTDNSEWGVPCPEIDGLKNQTFYVWPESLWAPISFTKTYLESQNKPADEWKKYWCSKQAKVYQFMGEDNLYFYGPAQQALFLNMNKNPKIDAAEGEFQLTKICPIKSILYMNQKASSSGSVKPPMASEFLKYYTPEQFRIHFLAMNLTNNNVGLSPKVFNPDAKPEDADPMVLEGNLLTNVFNRILRTIFYSTQNNFGSEEKGEKAGTIPNTTISQDTMEACKKTILDVERFMFDKKFHQVFNAVDVFIRNINKYWVKGAPLADTSEKLATLTANTLQMIVVANTLLHPIAPSGTENVADYIGLDKSKCFSWDNIFEPFYALLNPDKKGRLKPLKEKEDFFKKSEYQLKELIANK